MIPSPHNPTTMLKIGDKVLMRRNNLDYEVIVLEVMPGAPLPYLVYDYETDKSMFASEDRLHPDGAPPPTIQVYAVCDGNGNPKTGNSLFWIKDEADRLVDMLHSNGFSDTQVVLFDLTPSPQH
jgi:hypothetical protein